MNNSKHKWKIVHFLIMVGILISIVIIGLIFPIEMRSIGWGLTLVLMTVFVIIAGHSVTGLWKGFLIDGRNKISLSRFQMVAWTIMVLSAFLTIALVNIRAGVADPLAISIPSQLWILMGISTTSMIGSPLLLSTKREKQPDAKLWKNTVENLKSKGCANVEDKTPQMIITNLKPESAQWADLFRGEEAANAAALDLGKIQMFYFTIILVLAYIVALTGLFSSESRTIFSFPELHESMIALIGISHTGYLANKAVPHSPEAPQK